MLRREEELWDLLKNTFCLSYLLHQPIYNMLQYTVVAVIFGTFGPNTTETTTIKFILKIKQPEQVNYRVRAERRFGESPGLSRRRGRQTEVVRVVLGLENNMAW